MHYNETLGETLEEESSLHDGASLGDESLGELCMMRGGLFVMRLLMVSLICIMRSLLVRRLLTSFVVTECSSHACDILIQSACSCVLCVAGVLFAMRRITPS